MSCITYSGNRNEELDASTISNIGNAKKVIIIGYNTIKSETNYYTFLSSTHRPTCIS